MKRVSTLLAIVAPLVLVIAIVTPGPQQDTKAETSQVRPHTHQFVVGRMAFAGTLQRLAHVKHFEVNEYEGYGAPTSGPRMRRTRLRYYAPNRLRVDSNATEIHVGHVDCVGPQQWVCWRSANPDPARAVADQLLLAPDSGSGLLDVRFQLTTGRAESITITAFGNPWLCGPSSATCLAAQDYQPQT